MRSLSYLLAAVALVVSLLVLGGTTLYATTLQRLTTDDMVAQSTSIIRAKVTGSRSQAIGHDVYTYYQIQITDTLKAGATVVKEVAVPGGVAGNIRQIAIGSPVLNIGGDYVIFVWTGKSGMSQVIGLSQGLFAVGTNSAGLTVLSRPAISDQMLDRQGKPVADQAVTMTLSDLKTAIQKSQARGANQQ